MTTDTTPLAAYLSLSKDYVLKQELCNGSPSSIESVDAIGDRLDDLWWAMSPDDRDIVSEKIKEWNATPKPTAANFPIIG